MAIKYKLKSFSDLSPIELYDVLKLRQDVFVIEQECIYPDCDNYDQEGMHLIGYDGHEIATYLRILKPGMTYEKYSSIGRVIIATSYRKRGLSRNLLTIAIEYLRKKHPTHDIKISAQSHLEKMYASLGFKKSGSPYLEDGIPHIPMVLAFLRSSASIQSDS